MFGEDIFRGKHCGEESGSRSPEVRGNGVGSREVRRMHLQNFGKAGKPLQRKGP
jgi:hypothetical protein